MKRRTTTMKRRGGMGVKRAVPQEPMAPVKKRMIAEKVEATPKKAIPFQKVAEMPDKQYITPKKSKVGESPDYTPAYEVESPTQEEIEQLRKDEEVENMQSAFAKKMNMADGGRKKTKKRQN